MILEICGVIAVILFAVLVIFIIRTLCRLNKMSLEMEYRVKNFDSLLHSVSNVGDVCERASEQMKIAYLTRQNTCPRDDTGFNGDLVDWIVLSVKLGEKLINRRR